ncbi:MAG: hypothetical protein ACTSRG_25090 [Candidatus Helarchaeota archaeon]
MCFPSDKLIIINRNHILYDSYEEIINTIIHELWHFKQLDHTPSFFATVESFHKAYMRRFKRTILNYLRDRVSYFDIMQELQV